MNITDLRKKCRRSVERRIDERRLNSFEFESPEWIESIKKDYIFWPKADRRKKIRRANERRVLQRRHLFLDSNRSGKRSTMSLLSREEKELFMDIFNEDSK
jgi:hypothetical protein